MVAGGDVVAAGEVVACKPGSQHRYCVNGLNALPRQHLQARQSVREVCPPVCTN